MLRRTTSLLLAICVISLFLAPVALADSNEAKRAAVAEKVRSGIRKLGTGPEAKIELKLYDGKKIKGYVSEASDEQFVVVDRKTSTPIEVSYNSVKQIKGNNLSSAVKIAIGVGILLLLTIIIASQTD